MRQFSVPDEMGVHVLLRALIEAKLPGVPRDALVAASPLVAALANDVADARAEWPQNQSESWRILDPSHDYWWPAIARTLYDVGYFRTAASERRESYVRSLIAPYTATDEVFAELMMQIEKVVRERRWYEVYIRPEDPFNGGLVVLRETADGGRAIYDPAGSELAASLDHYAIGEWIFDRGFTRVGCFVQRPEPRNPEDEPE